MIWKQMLPISAKELSERFFRKLAMSSAPTPCCSSHYQNVDQDSHCTVMAILHYDHPKQLVFCRIGDTKWTTLDSDECYADLLYFSKNKLFYALCDSGSIESWDLTDPSFPKRSLAISTVPPHFSSDSTQYLVESSGDLLMVIRHWGDCPNDLDNNIMTWKFDVYKRDFVENNWVHVPSLNDHILFIGQNHAVSLSAHEFPGLRKNSIYFTPEYLDLDEQSWGCWDLGVFNLENKILYQFDLRLEIQASPIWVVPQL
ncbi:putative F-box protein At5g55150 [Cornus florida]|uniref:putative F-box protein At5g55150 n=1 Tax=Cornus florida TaxID=4283 RepID=UPI00289EABAB|nr:putative F-box protein At5g55150 [Cornus florida]